MLPPVQQYQALPARRCPVQVKEGDKVIYFKYAGELGVVLSLFVERKYALLLFVERKYALSLFVERKYALSLFVERKYAPSSCAPFVAAQRGPLRIPPLPHA